MVEDVELVCFTVFLNLTSIEGIISQYIFKKFGGTTTKFTWIGGEDKSSLVLGSGRPFFVKLHHPNKRTSKLTSIDLDSIKLKKFKNY